MKLRILVALLALLSLAVPKADAGFSVGANYEVLTSFTAADANATLPAGTRIVVLGTTFTASRTFTLPAANTLRSGQGLTVLNPNDVLGAFSAIFARAGSDLINGVSTSYSMGNKWDAITFYSDGVSKWTFAQQPLQRGGTGGTTTTSARSGISAAQSGTNGDITAITNTITVGSTTGGGTAGTINTGTNTTTGSGGAVNTSGATGKNGGAINTSAASTGAGGAINTSGGASADGGSITTNNGGGSINTTGTGSIGLGTSGTRTTLVGSATSDVTQTLPNKTGTIADLSDILPTMSGGTGILNLSGYDLTLPTNLTLQFRRGTDAQRLAMTPAIGEPLWTTDTKKLYVGDGTTVGGILIGPP